MANKKINQLVSKTAILSTDLFGIGDATTGQLFKKTIAELQAAIGGAVISVNGLVGTVVLDTDDIQELATPTNKYFTDARARGAISLTVTGNSGASTYSSGTGVLNVPTYTLAGLGGITASFLSGTSGISYNSTTGVISYSGTVYTDASIRALFSGSTGITYNSSTGAISYSGTVYTDSSVRALISLTTTGTSGASTYNNTTGVINVPEYTLAGLGGISLTSLSGGTGITYNSSTGQISYSGTVYTDASVRALFSASGSVSYNNTTGVISLTGGNLTEATSSVLTITGGSGAVIGGGTSIQVKQATTSVSGFLSSTDWTTFNNKQATITLTTTGTSGAATFSSNTLNIPNYGSALSGYLPLTGGTLTGALGGTTASFSSSIAATNITNNGIYYGKANASFPTTSLGYFALKTNNLDAERGGLTVQVSNSTSTFIDALSINYTGAATFSSSVTAGGNIAASGTGNITIQAVSSNNFPVFQLVDNRVGGNAWNFEGGRTLGNLALRDSNAGIERMTWTSAGNVGIGTTTPNTKLVVTGGVTNSIATISASIGTNNAINIGDDGTNAVIGVGNSGTDMLFLKRVVGVYSEAMRITSAGNVGIGTSAPTSAGGAFTGLDIRGSSGGSLIMGTVSTAYGIMYGESSGFHVQTSTATPLIFLTNATERMRITSGGNILMGTTTDNGERLYVSGAIRATSTITANSDITLKKNLLKIENALEKVEQINGYTYELKEDDSKRHAGVIAQEIQTVLPEIVNKGNDGILGVEYGNISALLIEAIKEQQTQINELKALLNK